MNPLQPLLSLVLALLLAPAHGQGLSVPGDACCAEGRCTGSAYCTACTNCTRCAYCNSGGSCGVCSRAVDPARNATPPTPASKTPSVGPNSRTYPSIPLNKPNSPDHDKYKVEYWVPEVHGHALVSASMANLRQGPGMSGEVVARLKAGTLLEVLAYQGDWIWVNVANTPHSGFIHRSVVAEQ